MTNTSGIISSNYNNFSNFDPDKRFYSKEILVKSGIRANKYHKVSGNGLLTLTLYIKCRTITVFSLYWLPQASFLPCQLTMVCQKDVYRSQLLSNTLDNVKNTSSYVVRDEFHARSQF